MCLYRIFKYTGRIQVLSPEKNKVFVIMDVTFQKDVALFSLEGREIAGEERQGEFLHFILLVSSLYKGTMSNPLESGDTNNGEEDGTKVYGAGTKIVEKLL